MTKKGHAKMSDAQFRSALAHRAEAKGAEGLSISLKEITDRGMIDLRGLADDASFMAKAKEVLGVDLPTKPRSVAQAGDIVIWWLSIDQWLVFCMRDHAAALAAKLASALADVHALAVDVSDMRSILRLEGDHARVVMNKGTSVDFTDGSMPAGTVRRLRYAEIAAAAHVVSDAPCVIDMVMFRSYAEYTWSYLTRTAAKPTEVQLFGPQIGISV